jgi:cytochrome c oxidase cbb3-type subunit I
MLGVFGFWLMGVVTYLWPKVTGKEWWSLRLNAWHFWLSAVGTLLMFADLTIAGLIQGFSWKALQPWEASIIGSFPYWMVRTFAGTMITTGMVLWAYNLYRTARNPVKLGDAAQMLDPQHEIAPASMNRPAVAS